MLERRLRLYTGLVLAAFLVSHFINHSLGLLSLDTMEAYRRVNALVWQNPVGTVALLGFARAGTEVLALATDPETLAAIASGCTDATPDGRRLILGLEPKVLWAMGALLVLALAGREEPVIVYTVPDPSTIAESITVSMHRDGISDLPIV